MEITEELRYLYLKRLLDKLLNNRIGREKPRISAWPKYL